MRSYLTVAISLVFLISTHGMAQPSGPPPIPTGFDPSAVAPPNLPAKLDLPFNTRVDVTASRVIPLPAPAQPNDPRLGWDPDLKSAVIERGPRDVHAVFNWEGGRSTEAFVIHNTCFRIYSLSYPDLVGTSGSVLNFRVNHTNSAEGSSGDFPGIYWYSPSIFCGTASVNGSRVYVFAPGQKKTDAGKVDASVYPGGRSICLDSKTLLPVYLNDGENFIYTFTYSPDPNVQINPQGNFLKQIQKRLGHYP
jgi:hypothetical protein